MGWLMDSKIWKTRIKPAFRFFILRLRHTGTAPMCKELRKTKNK